MRGFLINLAIFVAIIALFPAGAHAADKPVKVGCIGNSITFGYLIPNREKNNYPFRLQELLGNGYEVRNFGKSGATLLRKGHKSYFEQPEFADAIDFAPDIIVVHLGVNDTDPRNYPNFGDEFVADYMALIDSFRMANPDVRVILANLSPLLSKHKRYKSGTRAWRDSIRTLIPEIAEATGSELIDFGQLLRDYPNLIPDGIHPDAEGAKLMARYVGQAITGDFGGLSLPDVYADRMVLQRYKPLQITGTANAGDKVTVNLGTNTRSAITDTRGKWQVVLPPMKEATGLEMKVFTARDTLTFKDVAVGEVWIASGQSNMRFQLQNCSTYDIDKDQLDDSLLRLYNMAPIAFTGNVEWTEEQKALTDSLKYFRQARWMPSRENSAGNFSAVAWYFGKMMRDSLRVPVGIIANAVGGAPTEAWIDIETLEHAMPEILVDWRGNDYVQPWVQQRADLNTGSVKNRHRHPYEPSYLFASGIRQLGTFPAAGVIWYQGESNAHNIEVHEALFTALVDSWRAHWHDPQMPFLFVQLSSLDRPSWPKFRDSQRLLSHRIPGVAMAVCSDVGDSLDVHPTNKKPVGQRLGRQALNRVYGMANVTPQGPEIRSACLIGANRVELTFDYADGLTTADGNQPLTFEIAAFEGLFIPVDSAVITSDNKITLYSMSIEQPRFVRYGWQPFTRANLVNSDGLPASTFRVALTPSIEPEEGIEAGVSGFFLGTLNDSPIMAGGCNFPHNPMAPDSKKKFYKGIYRILQNDDTRQWYVKQAGTLPEPTAYGATVSTPEGIYLIGGQTPTLDLKTVNLLRQDTSGSLNIENMPPLPATVNNAAAAYIDGKIYLAGGNIDGSPSNRLFCLDTRNTSKGWKELKSFPGNPRLQPVMAAALDSKGNPTLYLWGGFAGKSQNRDATLNTDGLRYDIKKNRWCTLPAPKDPEGEEISTGGAAATVLPDGHIAIVGGVNKDIFLEALRNQAPDYLSHPADWYRFNQRLLVFSPHTEEWKISLPDASLARAGASIIAHNNGILVVGGEIKPRIRTSDIVEVDID